MRWLRRLKQTGRKTDARAAKTKRPFRRLLVEQFEERRLLATDVADYYSVNPNSTLTVNGFGTWANDSYNESWADMEWDAEWQWHEGYTENPVLYNGYYEYPVWHDGYLEQPAWQEGYLEDPVWHDGYYDDPVWHEGYTEQPVWQEGYTEDPVWYEGYWDENNEWHDGYYSPPEPVWHEGYYSPPEPVWHEGYYEDPVWHEGYYDDPVWHEGYWDPPDAVWHDGYLDPPEPVWHEPYYSPPEPVWHDGYWEGQWVTTATYHASSVIASQPAHGTLNLIGSGEQCYYNGSPIGECGLAFTYTPNAGFTGTDLFTYTLSDNEGSSTAMVKIIVDHATFVVPEISASEETVRITRAGDVDRIEVTASGTSVTYEPSIGTFDKIYVGASGDNNSLIIDLSGGDPIPGGFIQYDGGSGSSNALQLINGRRTESTRMRLAGNVTSVAVTDSGLEMTEPSIAVNNLTLDGGSIRVPDGGKVVTANSVTVNSTENYVDVGTGSKVHFPLGMSANARLTKTGAGTLTVSGGVHGAGSQFVAAGGETVFLTDAGAGTATKNLAVRASNAGTRVEFLTSQKLNSLVIDTGAYVRLADGGGRRLWLDGLDIDLSLTNPAASQLDLGNGLLVLGYVNQPNPTSGVQQMLRTSHSVSTLNGPGIVSSTVRAANLVQGVSPISALASADNDLLGLRYQWIESNNQLTYAQSGTGTALPLKSVLVGYGIVGDANLDRVIDATDQAALTAGMNNQGPWTSGDFNYSGLVDSADQTLFTSGLSNQSSVGTRAPIILDATIPIIQKDTTRRFGIRAVDPRITGPGQAANQILFSLVNPPSYASISSDGEVTFTGVTAEVRQLTVRASQTNGVSADRPFNVHVIDSPDLTITTGGFTTTASDDENGLLKLSYFLSSNAVAPFNIGVFSSNLPSGAASDVRLMTYRVSEPGLLTAGTHTVTFRADWTDADKDYYLIARVDSDGELPESQEANNVSSFTGGVFLTLDGTLQVHGTDSSDNVSLDSSSEPGLPKVYFNSTPFVINGDVPVTALHVRLHTAGDLFYDGMEQGNWTLPQRIYGGAGADTITVRSRVALVDSGDGSDSLTVGGTSRVELMDVGVEGIQIAGSGRVTFRNAESVGVAPDFGDDRVRYRGIPNGTTGVVIDAGEGIDQLDLSGAVGTLPSQNSVSGIEALDLSHRSLSTISSTFFDFLTDKGNLKNLDLRYNNVNLAVGTALASVASNLPSLNQLSLYGNPSHDVSNSSLERDPDLAALAGKWLRVDLAPLGLAKAEVGATEIAALAAIAKSLHYLPLEIFEYVLNGYEYEPYVGRMKDPLAVVQTHAGNDFDLSNLLIKLFTSAGISESNLQLARNKHDSHYAYLDAAALRDWFGTTVATAWSQDAALEILRANDVEHESLPNSGSGPLTAVGFDHVWVETNVGGAWKPLNPSYKVTERSSVVASHLALISARLGISYPNFGALLSAQVPLNPGLSNETSTLSPADTHVDSYFTLVGGEIRTNSIYEWYEDRVSKWLAVNAPGLTLADLKHEGTIAPRRIEAVEQAWPDQLRFTQDGSTSVTYDLASSYREAFTPASADHHRLVVNAINSSNGVAVWGGPTTLKVSEHSLSDILVMLDSSSVPQLYVNGAARTGTFFGPYQPGQEPFVYDKFKLNIQFFKAGNTTTTADTIGEYERSAGTVVALTMDGNQLTDRRLFDLTASVNARELAAVVEANGAANADTPLNAFSILNGPNENVKYDVGTFLTLVGSTYFRRNEQGQAVLDGLLRATQVVNQVAVGAVSALPGITKSSVNDKLQFPVTLAGLQIDVPQNATEGVSLDSLAAGGGPNGALKLRNVLAAYNASGQEHAVLEEMLNSEGMSTIKSFQIARQNGTTFHTFENKEQWDNWLTANPSTDLTTVDVAIDKIFDSPLAGAGGIQSVYLPLALTPKGNWSGIGFIAKYANLTRFGIVSSSPNSVPTYGGLPVDSPQASPFPSTDPPPAPSLNVPVNLVTGAVTADVTDISIPAIGLPLTFSRHYDSNSASQADTSNLSGLKDLGQGWWHNFSDRLYDGGTTLAPYYPTASVDWVDSQGRRFTFTRNGSIYIGPAELKGEFSYDVSDHEYTYRDRSGLARRFNLDGTLNAILDLYGNRLQLSYSAGKLSTVESIPASGSGTVTVANKLQFSYGANGKISSVSEILGTGAAIRVWSYTQTSSNSRHYLTQVQTPTATVAGASTALSTQYSYYLDGESSLSTRHGKLKDITGPDGGNAHFDYYANGRAFRVSDPEGFSQTLQFDLMRKRTTVFDPRNNVTTSTFNANGNLVQVQFPDRARRTMEWDETEQRIKSETDEGNLTRAFGYDQNDTYDNVSRIDAQITAGYDVQGNRQLAPAFATDNFEFETLLGSNGLLLVSRLTKATTPSGVANSPRQTTYLYDVHAPGAYGSPVFLRKVIDSDMRATYFTRDANGLVTDIKGRSWQTASGQGSTTSATDDLLLPLMSRQTFLYNSAGQVTTTTTFVSQTGPSQNEVETISEHTAYDEHGYLVSSTNGRQITTFYHPDDLGWVTRVDIPATTNLAAASTYQVFNALGIVTSSQDAAGRATAVRFDKRQQPTKTINADGTIVTREYDAAGNVVSETNELGHTTRWIYDNRNRAVEVIRADGTSTVTRFDGRGHVVGTLDRLRNEGLVVAASAIGSDGLVRRESSSIYDVRGLLMKHIAPDPDGDATIDAGAAVTGYQYDVAGNLLSVVDARSPFRAWQNASNIYDVNNDGALSGLDHLVLTNKLNSIGSGQTDVLPLAPLDGVFYDVNGDGRVSGTDLLMVGNALNMPNPPQYVNGVVYRYDRLGRVIKQTSPNAVNATLDSTLQHTAATWTDTWTYQYDQQTSTAHSSVTGDTSDLGGAGYRTIVTDPLGRVTKSDYDQRGRLRRQTIEQAGGQLSKSTNVYDSTDNLIETVDPRGYLSGNSAAAFKTVYQYDSRNQLTLLDLPNTTSEGSTLQHQTSFKYDQVGNVVRSHEGPAALWPDKAQTHTEYDVRNRPTKVRRAIEMSGLTYGPPSIPSVEEVTTTTYDAAGNVRIVTDALGRKSQFVYDVMNRPLVSVDALGNRTTSAYTDLGTVHRATDAAGQETTASYDLLGRTRQELYPDPDGAGSGQALEHAYWYNTAGDIAQEAALKDQPMVYVGLYEQVSVPVYEITKYSHDRLGRLVQQTDADPDEWIDAISLLPTSGSPTTTSRDNDVLTSPVHAFRYNAVGKLIREVDPRNVSLEWLNEPRIRTDYVYDGLDRLMSVTLPDSDYDPTAAEPNDGPEDRPVWQYSYDVNGNLLHLIDPLNRKTAHTYNELNLATKTEVFFDADDLSPQTNSLYDYDNRDNLVRVMDSGVSLTNLITTRFEYDLIDRQTVVNGMDATVGGVTQTRVSSTVYDAAGNVVATVDPADRRTTFQYDALNRLTSTLVPSLADQPGKSVSTYDANSNLIRSIDALGHVTSFAYDQVNRLISEKDPNGELTTRTFDTLGNLKTVVDPRGVKTAYKYDQLNRVTHEGILTSPSGASEQYAWRTYSYDANSNLTEMIDRNSRKTSYEYDLLNRLTSESWFATASSTLPLNLIASKYDQAGQLKSVVDGFSFYALTYDHGGRILSELNIDPATSTTVDGMPAVRLDYQYRADGQRSLFKSIVSGSSPPSRQFSYSYDAAGRPASMHDDTSSASLFTFQYDGADQLTQLKRQNGNSGQIVPTTNYSYELATGRLSGIEHTYAVGLNASQPSWTRYIDAFGYSYDRGDRLTAWNALKDGPTSYAYDKNGQLTGAQRPQETNADETYAYDDSGNRASSTLASSGSQTYVYDNQNRLTSDGVYTYTYDPEGNLKTRWKPGSPGEHVTYTWDHRNRLTQVEYRADVNGVGAVNKLAVYTYDALDRRIKKVVDSDGDGTAPADTTRYAYDGDELYLEFNGSNQLTHRYLHGPAIDQILADEDLSLAAGSRWRWTLTDHENSVRDVMDSQGNVTVHKAYDSFGRVLTSEISPTATDLIFGYTGRQLDPETGLQFNRVRYYDSATGRFISADPIGFGGGDYNLYRYAGNSPIAYSDPSGMGLFDNLQGSGYPYMGSNVFYAGGGTYIPVPGGSFDMVYAAQQAAAQQAAAQQAAYFQEAAAANALAQYQAAIEYESYRASQSSSSAGVGDTRSLIAQAQADLDLALLQHFGTSAPGNTNGGSVGGGTPGGNTGGGTNTGGSTTPVVTPPVITPEPKVVIPSSVVGPPRTPSSSLWWPLRRLDQFAGQVYTGALTWEWVDPDQASGVFFVGQTLRGEFGTGGKVIVNGISKTGVSFATLGFAQGGNLIPVNDFDESAGYNYAEGGFRIFAEADLALATGGLSTLRGAGYVNKLAQAARYYDLVGNTVSVGRGSASAYQDGPSVGSSFQIAGGLAGWGGNYASWTRAPSSNVLGNANFAQLDYDEVFSAPGIKELSKLGGGRIITIDDLASAIRTGRISASDVPIQYIQRGENVLILNTRTSQALQRANIPRSQWNAVNMTSNRDAQNRLTDQLLRNGLTNQGEIRPMSQGLGLQGVGR